MLGLVNGVTVTGRGYTLLVENFTVAWITLLTTEHSAALTEMVRATELLAKLKDQEKRATEAEKKIEKAMTKAQKSSDPDHLETVLTEVQTLFRNYIKKRGYQFYSLKNLAH